MKCSNCNSEIQPGYKFCMTCGNPVQNIASVTPPPAQPEKIVEEVPYKTEAPVNTTPVYAESAAVKPAVQPQASAAKPPVQHEVPATKPPVQQKAPAAKPSVQPKASVKAAAPSKPEKVKAPKQKKERKKISKAKIAVAIGIPSSALIALLIGIICILVLISPKNQLLRALDNEDYTKAISVYNEYFVYDSDNSLIKSLRKRISETTASFENEEISYETAHREFSAINNMAIYELSTEIKDAISFIESLNASRTAFSTAQEMFADGDYEGAIINYRNVESFDKNYTLVNDLLDDAINKYRDEILKKVKNYAQNEKYSEIMTELEMALELLPDDSKLTEQYKVYERKFASHKKESSLADAVVYAEKGDYAKAVKVIGEALEVNKKDAELLVAYDEYKEAYLGKVFAESDAFCKTRDFDSALSVIKAALKVLPDEKKLNDEANRLENNKPVSLATLKTINGGWEWNEGNPIDPFENTYSDVSNYKIFAGSTSFYAEYRVYGKYNIITASMVPHADIGEDGEAQVKIYADDELVYTSPYTYRKTDLSEFSVNIAGAEYIKIVVTVDDNRAYGNYDCFMLLDCQLWKE